MKKMASLVLKSGMIKSHPNLTSPLKDYSSVKTADELYSKIHKCLTFQPELTFSLTHVDRSKENFFIDVEKIDRIYHLKASGNFYKLIARMLVNNHFMYVYMTANHFKYSDKNEWKRNGNIFYNRNSSKFLRFLKKDNYVKKNIPDFIKALENIEEFAK